LEADVELEQAIAVENKPAAPSQDLMQTKSKLKEKLKNKLNKSAKKEITADPVPLDSQKLMTHESIKTAPSLDPDMA